MDLILMMSYNSVNANVGYCCQEDSNKFTNNNYYGPPTITKTVMTRFEVTSSRYRR